MRVPGKPLDNGFFCNLQLSASAIRKEPYGPESVRGGANALCNLSVFGGQIALVKPFPDWLKSGKCAARETGITCSGK